MDGGLQVGIDSGDKPIINVGMAERAKLNQDAGVSVLEDNHHG